MNKVVCISLLLLSSGIKTSISQPLSTNLINNCDISVRQNNSVMLISEDSVYRTNFQAYHSPSLSYDKKKLAIVKAGDKDNRLIRKIEIINIANNKKGFIPINTSQQTNPKWSPNENILLFEYVKDSGWESGIYHYDSGFVTVPDSDSGTRLYSPTWSIEGDVFTCHDMHNHVMVFDSDGKILKKIKINSIFESKLSLSSSSSFIYDKEKESLFFQAYLLDVEMKYHFDKLSALFEYNLNTKKLKRITENDMSAVHIKHDKKKNIYIETVSNTKESKRCIYRLDLYTLNISKITCNDVSLY